MKGGTVQIHWHGSDPILSLDFHFPSGLLATAGADRDIKLWALHREEKSKLLPSATFRANLSYHNAAVNVLRFSPSGELLASGGDGGELVLWKTVNSMEDVPSWKVWKTLGRHQKDILDLEWSPDGAFLVSASVDNTCIIWDATKGSIEQILSDHQHYVQGVTWDPTGQYLASLSGDRTCRIYSRRCEDKKLKSKSKTKKGLFFCQQVLCKRDPFAGANSEEAIGPKRRTGTLVSEDGALLPTDEESLMKQVSSNPTSKASSTKQYLFYDENMPSFFRRLAWSPDGSFLIIPSGFEKRSAEALPCSMSYVVSRENLSRPALQLPAASKPVVAVRFCPVVFSLSSKTAWKHDLTSPDVAAFQLPFRLVFAVATLNSVFIYDTQKSCPIAVFGGLHYAAITDLAWSFDAKYLAVSSQDGFCTLVGFDDGDLGLPMSKEDIPSYIERILPSRETCEVRYGLPSKQMSPKSSDGVQGPTTPVPQHGPSPTLFKPPQEHAEIYVRPLKFRRITPKAITEDQQEANSGSKRATCETSLMSSMICQQNSACQEATVAVNVMNSI